MTFTGVFTGSPVQPSQVAYRAFTITSNTTLFWPSQSVDTTDVVARWNSVSADSGLSITLGAATAIGVGQDAAFANVGSNTFSILADGGATIATVGPGVVIYLICTDNSDAAGMWQAITFGAGSSSAQASALAGAGLIAAGAVINQNYVTNAHGSNYTVVGGDLATVIRWTGGAGTLTLPDPAVVGAGFFIQLVNSGSGALTVSPAAGTIDGAATKAYNQTDSSFIVSNGALYYSVGFGRSVTVTFTQLVKSVAGNVDVTLTSTEAANQMQQYTGALTGNINVIVPSNVAEYFVFNNTTGAFTLTVKTAAGTGVAVAQGTRTLLTCDATNVNSAISAGGGTVTSVATGTGLTGGPVTTTGTIALANTAVVAGSYVAANITVDAQGRITAAASSGASGGTVTSVTAGTGLSGGTITVSGTIALANTAVVAGTYAFANITVDAQGRITAASASTGLSVAAGGTGQSTYTDGQLLIGNTTGNTLTKATLTAGTNITITNGHGTITIAASSSGAGAIYSNFVLLTNASSSPWSVPAGVSRIMGIVMGAGGGGGGANVAGGSVGLGSGGGAGYFVTCIMTVTPSGTLAFTIGAGGTAGSSGGSDGGAGGNTTLGGTVTAPGGRGGIGINAAGNAAGAPVTAMVPVTPTSSVAIIASEYTFNDAGVGGPTGGGNAPGCSTQWGTGGNGATNGTQAGSAATGYGASGGGGGSNNGFGHAGGAGAPGAIVILY